MWLLACLRGKGGKMKETDLQGGERMVIVVDSEDPMRSQRCGEALYLSQ